MHKKFFILIFSFLYCFSIYSINKENEDNNIKKYLKPGARVILPGGFAAVRLSDKDYDNIADGVDLNKDHKLDLIFKFKDKRNVAVISIQKNKTEFFLYLTKENNIIIYYEGEEPEKIYKLENDRKLVLIKFWESSAFEISGGLGRGFIAPFTTPYLYTVSISYSRGLDNLYQNVQKKIASRNQAAPGIKISADFVGYITPLRRVILAHLEAGLLWRISFSKFSYGFLSPSFLIGANYRESINEQETQKTTIRYLASYHASIGVDYIFPIIHYLEFTAGIRSRLYLFYGNSTGIEYHVTTSGKLGIQFLF